MILLSGVPCNITMFCLITSSGETDILTSTKSRITTLSIVTETCFSLYYVLFIDIIRTNILSLHLFSVKSINFDEVSGFDVRKPTAEVKGPESSLFTVT
jgi:hypothetical protein